MDRMEDLEPTTTRVGWAAEKAFAAYGPLKGVEAMELVGTDGFIQLFYWWLARAPQDPLEEE